MLAGQMSDALKSFNGKNNMPICMLREMLSAYLLESLHRNNGVSTQSRRAPWTAEEWTGHVRKNHIPVDDIVLVAIPIL